MITPTRQPPGWKRGVEVRKVVNKDKAYEEGMRSRVETKVFTDGSDIDGGVGATVLEPVKLLVLRMNT